MNKVTLGGVLALLVSAEAAHGFEIDQSLTEQLSAHGHILVGELTVGERARMHRNGFCHENSMLFLVDTAIVTDRSLGDYVIMRNPDGQFDVDFVPHDWQGERTSEVSSAELFAYLDSCESFREHWRSVGFFPVATIDGFASLSEWTDYVVEKFDIREQ